MQSLNTPKPSYRPPTTRNTTPTENRGAFSTRCAGSAKQMQLENSESSLAKETAHAPSAVAMPSLATLTPPQHLNMDIDKKAVGYSEVTFAVLCFSSFSRGGNLKSRLQCKLSQPANTEELCFEEMSQWSQSLERLLSSKYGMKIFQAFLKSEFSDENLEFWVVCEDYKKIKSSFRMSSRAKKIFKLYIQAEAPREINIDHKTREVIRTNMKVASTVCFEEAQKIVYGLMEKDSYPRFLKSDIYRTLLDSTSAPMRM
ncbi:hypothetical protein CCH79_00011348 [Gambusia affinis]|uniref:RGS domain-containing protein n=2 Tax=Poeciliinae TaxID=586240 RepID=A0A315V2M8_GAMAF|nr:hypothetical protein CCH79_00011348 [Gambusia affinis]